MPEPRLEDEGITCPRCGSPCGLDYTDESGQEYLCLACGARVRVSGRGFPMPELHSLEEWASRCGQLHAVIVIDEHGTPSRPDDLLCQNCARAYVEQRLEDVTESVSDLHDTSSKGIERLQKERDALLAVVRAAHETRLRVMHCKICGHTWLLTAASKHYTGCPVAHPGVQRLLKAVTKKPGKSYTGDDQNV